MTLRDRVREFERDCLATTLRDCNGRIDETAERSGLDKKTLYRKMRKHGLDKEDFKKQEEGVTDGRAESTDNGAT